MGLLFMEISQNCVCKNLEGKKPQLIPISMPFLMCKHISTNKEEINTMIDIPEDNNDKNRWIFHVFELYVP